MATAIQVGHTAKAIKFVKATKGAEQMARVTPAKVRMRPCNQVVNKDFLKLVVLEVMIKLNHVKYSECREK